MQVLGQHVLVEFYECVSPSLNNQADIEQFMQEAARKSGATIVESVFHTFNPHGVSGVIVIAESHLAIHTWPEYSYAAIDLFTCGSSVDPWAAFEVLRDRLQAARYEAKELCRGIPAQTSDAPDVRIRHKPQLAV